MSILQRPPTLTELCELAVDTGRKYDELIYAVVRKFPGETRHQTALRYIQEAESRIVGPAKESLSTLGAGPKTASPE